MKNQNTEKSVNQSEISKLAYSSPVLQVYGSVGTLTKGGNGSGADKQLTKR